MSVINIVKRFQGVLKHQVKERLGENPKIDSLTFQLHYRLTSTILFLSSTLLLANNLIGKPIQCVSGNIPNGLLNTYCWITSTFSVTNNNANVLGEHYAYPGVQPFIQGQSDKRTHKYYQWVPFVLFFQGLMFYLPHYLWKILEGQKMKTITKTLLGRTLQEEQRFGKCSELAKYLAQTFTEHNAYALKYVVCEILNFVNVLFQLYFVNIFLDGIFLRYGPKVLEWSLLDDEERTDPMIEAFPRLTKCTFRKYGPSGTIEVHDALCVLALNILNEKIYVAMWFWFVVLAIITFFNLVYTSVFMTVPSVAVSLIRRRNLNQIQEMSMIKEWNKEQIGGWFLLLQLSRNIDRIVFEDFIRKFIEKPKSK